MLQLILTKGLPASGKTTWAKQQLAEHPGTYKRINKDDLRAMLDDGKWSKMNEKFVLATRDALILSGLAAGYHIIIDDTNLDPKHEKQIRALVKGKAEVRIQDFTDVALETCLERDRQRPNSVGEKVIRGMWQRYLAPPVTVQPPHEPGQPIAIICDLDGTIALLNGRNPYDASSCEQDLLNEPVATILRLNQTRAEGERHHLFFMSGREERHRPQTERWLARHGLIYDGLFMRPTGDSRKDAIIKRELYEAHIASKYHVMFVLDDRSSVVQVWRSLGLTCLQVAEGDF